MVYLLVRIYGLGWETADSLVMKLLFLDITRPQSCSPLCRIDRLTGSKRFEATKSAFPARATRGWKSYHNPAGLAHGEVPARQCSGTMVQTTHRECKGSRLTGIRACPQAHHCPLALCE